MIRGVTADSLTRLAARAGESPRRRANLELHPGFADPVQRFFNVVEPGTYVRPHRHATERWECFVLLSGSAAVLEFDDLGAVTAWQYLEPRHSLCVEIDGGTWHSLIALKPRTLLFEVKPGPYDPSSDKEFALWAPPEADAAGGAALVSRWERRFRLSGSTG